MIEKDLGDLKKELNKKYDTNILKIEENENGSMSFLVDKSGVSKEFLKDKKLNDEKVIGSVVNRPRLDRTYLDLQDKTSTAKKQPHDLYKQSAIEYKNDAIYGASINVLSNFACKGFENDSEDLELKHFFDCWCFDVDFEEVLEWIFLDFFRMGMVRTYKILGKYEPGINNISDINPKSTDEKDNAAAKTRWSKTNVPLKYTILNPNFVEIEGSLLFGDTKTTLKPNDELKELFKKSAKELTIEEKTLIQKLPAPFKKAIKDGKNIELDPTLVGEIDYRKMPYERYGVPKGSRVFESLNYKRSLRDADLSTLDGITNYILKITVGSDQFPVTSQAQLEQVAQLFNTPSKSFDVVYNHTLKVEKITSPEIEAILGKNKYEQVNEDISGGLALPRVLLDGVGDLNTAEVNTVVKSVVEEIRYARKCVTRWIYREYIDIANATGFEKIPRIRWDDTILKDILMYMSIIGQLVDRRMLSYKTALERLGFNFPSELTNMREELPIVLDEGAFGISGSPWQQSKTGLQNTQNAPKGTPSYGKPSGEEPTENNDNIPDKNDGTGDE
ncbi:MAG: hypothetical protein U9R15_09750 [Chloroflexota bacterium]|nr:hypothetical protein [Chloroflexota bacterium]